MLVAIPEAPENSVSPSNTPAGSSSGNTNENKQSINRPKKFNNSITTTPNSSLHSSITDLGDEGGGESSGMSSSGGILVRGNNGTNGSILDFPMMEPLLPDHTFQQQLLQLKQEQELQHQLLLQRYQAQRQQLAQAHEKQLQQRLKVIEFWENKRRQDEERERLEALKKKEKHEQSAVASSEVKQKLQGFLLNKKQRESKGGGVTTSSSSPPYRSWAQTRNLNGGELDEIQESGTNLVHPYKRPLHIPKYDDEFPLRKTASEPNLLKMRLKQRVLDRRSSPLVRRRDKSTYLKRRSYLATEGSGSAGSTPDSGPNSPPINGCLLGRGANGSGERTPLGEEAYAHPHPPHHPHSSTSSSSYANQQQQQSSDFTLYSSPSLPNISLGKPLPPQQGESKLCAVSETEVRCQIPPPVGIPMLPLPYFPHPVPQLEPAALESLYQSGGFLALYGASQQVRSQMGASGVGDLEGGRSNGRTRPLGRTQSAPLPLQHPLLLLNTHHNPSSLVNGISGGRLPPPPPLDPAQAHQLLRQHIRQTVLTRVGSRGQMMSSLNRTISVEEDSGEGEDNEVPESKPHLSSSSSNRTHLVKQHSTPTSPPIQEGGVKRGVNYRPQSPRPLSRALSSPLVPLLPPQPNNEMCGSGGSGRGSSGTGLGFDSLMLKHACVCGDNSQHPEHPGRLQSIWARLQETGLLHVCDRVRSRKATLEEIQCCHSEAHTLLFGTNPLSRGRVELSRFPESSLPIQSLVRLPCNGIGVDSDTAWNELHTPSAARMAAGTVLDLAFRIARGELRNGFAIVRPPGHHAEPVQAMGFCFFNSVAIAAKQLRTQLNLQKILIVDWDVHHGNGTQQIFYDDPHVLYLSIHRHDDGNFFPGTGSPTECGAGSGLGFNVNVGWGGGLDPPMGDAEYLAAFRSVVMPIGEEFGPDIVLVSCGFDAAAGHPPPLGGYTLSPACFGLMTQQLMTLANGKVLLALEGGYDLPAICDSAEEVVKALLGEKVGSLAQEELLRPPTPSAVSTLLRTIRLQSPHWAHLSHYASLIPCSALEASRLRKSPLEETETLSAMASLSMRQSGMGEEFSSPSNSFSGGGGDRGRDYEEPMEEDEK